MKYLYLIVLITIICLSNHPKDTQQNTTVRQSSLTGQYQGESSDRKQHLKSAIDEERAEQSQAVVSQVFKWQLEDVSPANAAKIDLFCRAVGSAAQHKELSVKATFDQFIWKHFKCSYVPCSEK